MVLNDSLRHKNYVALVWRCYAEQRCYNAVVDVQRLFVDNVCAGIVCAYQWKLECNVFRKVWHAYDWLNDGLHPLYGCSNVEGRGFSKAAVV